MTTSVQYQYADGSANLYVITPTSLEYDPVTPKESSTGTYSGGEPKTVSLTQAQFDSIRAVLEKGMNTTTVHIPDRVKGSGIIRMSDGKEKKNCILQQGCQEISEIETLLKKYLGN